MATVAPLQPGARALVGFLAAHPDPPLDEQTLAAARAGVVAAQGPAKDAEQHVIAGVPVYVYRPAGARGPLPVALYFHGGGWALCDHRTHDRLLRELAAAASGGRGLHAFVVLNALAGDASPRNAIAEAAAALRRTLAAQPG